MATKNETITRANGLTVLDKDRSLDFHRANLPNVAAELGYSLGVDSKAREMMREFFHENQDKGTRRSFRTASRLTMGYRQMQYIDLVAAEVEPIAYTSSEMVHI